jgi:hypothetical protein
MEQLWWYFVAHEMCNEMRRAGKMGLSCGLKRSLALVNQKGSGESRRAAKRQKKDT